MSVDRLSQYERVIEKDLQMLKALERFCIRRPILHKIIATITSKYPWRDITCLIWIIGLIGCVELGRRYFWITALNLILCYVANRYLQAPRPVEFDRSLQPLTDTLAESYGFPSVETYMSVVILFHYSFLSRYYLLFLPSLLLSVVIGFSRLYAKSRFMHQIFGSWVLGFVGLLLTIFTYGIFGDFVERLTETSHGGLVAVLIGIFVCVLALAMESNQSLLLYTPRKEYERVLSGILNGGKGKRGQVDSSSPRQTTRNEGSDVYNKRDSFYYLQRSLQTRTGR